MDRLRQRRARPRGRTRGTSLFAGAYHCDALVREDATATRFTLSAVLGASEASPPLAFAIMRHLAAGLRDARRRLELRSVHPLTERLLLRLAELADEAGQLPEDLIMRDIAAEIGATPEATYRAMAELVRQGRMVRVGRARFRMPVSAQDRGREKTP